MLTQTISDHYRLLSPQSLEFIEHMLKQDDQGASLDPDLLPPLLKPENHTYPINPWPVFVGGDAAIEIETASVQMHDLHLGIPERIFDMDPVKLYEYFKFRDVEAWKLALQEPTGLDGMFTRGDYMHDGEFFKCVELNCSANLGGYDVCMAADAYCQHPPIKRFLDGRGLKPTVVSPLEKSSEHMIEDCLRHGLGKKGELNIAVYMDPHYVGDVKFKFETFSAIFNQALKSRGLEGELILTTPEDLEFKRKWFKDLVFSKGKRLHGFMETAEIWPPMDMLRPYKAGNVRIYNGLLTNLISDKRNLVLLSEQDDGDLYSAEEKEIIRRHIPWTRRVRKGQTRFRGERLEMAEGLKKLKDQLVLKPADGLKGEGVYLGRTTSTDVWDRAVDNALADERAMWLAQELIESPAYLFPNNKGEVCEHDMVWGLFSMGDNYAGCILRTQPREGGDGVINAHKGASVCIPLRI